MRRVAAPTISDRDDQEDDLARIVLYFLLSSRVSLQDLECKLYDISMNISPVSQKKKDLAWRSVGTAPSDLGRRTAAPTQRRALPAGY